VGGSDPSSQPDLYKSADLLILSEGEVAIPMFIKELEALFDLGYKGHIDFVDEFDRC